MGLTTMFILSFLYICNSRYDLSVTSLDPTGTLAPDIKFLPFQKSVMSNMTKYVNKFFWNYFDFALNVVLCVFFDLGFYLHYKYLAWFAILSAILFCSFPRDPANCWYYTFPKTFSKRFKFFEKLILQLHRDGRCVNKIWKVQNAIGGNESPIIIKSIRQLLPAPN